VNKLRFGHRKGYIYLETTTLKSVVVFLEEPEFVLVGVGGRREGKVIDVGESNGPDNVGVKG